MKFNTNSPRAGSVFRGLALAMAASLMGAPMRPSRGADPPIAVVVNSAVPARQLGATELASIYRATVKQWSNGDPVVRLSFPPNHPVRASFDQVVLRMNQTQAGRYWIDQRIRGTAQAPKVVEDGKMMARALATVKGSIGYIPQSEVTAGMKVIAVLRDGVISPPR